MITFPGEPELVNPGGGEPTGWLDHGLPGQKDEPPEQLTLDSLPLLLPYKSHCLEPINNFFPSEPELVNPGGGEPAGCLDHGLPGQKDDPPEQPTLDSLHILLTAHKSNCL